MLLAGIAGFFVGLSSLRVRHDFLAITTMGVGFLFIGLVRQQDALGGEMGISEFQIQDLKNWIPAPGTRMCSYGDFIMSIYETELAWVFF